MVVHLKPLNFTHLQVCEAACRECAFITNKMGLQKLVSQTLHFGVPKLFSVSGVGQMRATTTVSTYYLFCNIFLFTLFGRRYSI